MRFVLLILFLIVSQTLPAQPRLEIQPDKIEFEDIFNRKENVFFINSGDEPLTIQAIDYNYDNYFIRFDKQAWWPITIEAGDTVMMDCILSGYYMISEADTVDTMRVYSSGENSLEEIRIKIDFFDNNFGYASLSGQVTDGTDPVSNAVVNFLYNGNYTFSSVQTDEGGFYYANLPPGIYSVAAEKDSYYVTFSGNKYDPAKAANVKLVKGDNKIINIQLAKMTKTGYSISGKILDAKGGHHLRSAIVSLRKGKHTPSKISSANAFDGETYSVFAKVDGSYQINNILQSDYYLVQAFSDYYIPAYYSEPEYSSVFWQQADSILINTELIDKNISLERDSAIGGGVIRGEITFENQPQDSVEGVIVLAKNVDFNQLYNYGFVKDSSSFEVNGLPYGSYQIIGQKFGYNDAVSNVISIDPAHIQVGSVQMNFTVASVNDKLPSDFYLYQNYPNPFNPSTTIEFNLLRASDVLLKVTNILGEQVSVLHDGYLTPGSYKFNFNASNLNSGVYFVTLYSGFNSLTRKIMLLK